MACMPGFRLAWHRGDLRSGDFKMMMVDQCVRLGMAIVIIALISLALYQFSGRAHARSVTPAVSTALLSR